MRSFRDSAAFFLVAALAPMLSPGTSSAQFVTGTGKATLTGTITFAGAPPVRKPIVDEKNKDANFCKMGDAYDQMWIVNKNKQIANVVVFISPPAGKKFKPVPAGQKWWKDNVTVDQPHCAFEPHVQVAFPQQKIEILNSAPIGHNTRYKGSLLKNPGGSTNLPPAKDKATPTRLPLALKPDTRPVALNCDIHTWMTGYIWVFDHPYAAVSAPNGSYKIENIPAGVPLDVFVWHESYKAPMKAGTITFNVGETKKDFTVKK